MPQNKNEEIRHITNPFELKAMDIPVGSKQVKLSALGKDNDILINQNTGEIKGTHIVTYKKVDADKFVKLFSSNIASIFDLTAAGNKAFNVLVWTISRSINKDLVILDSYTMEDFIINNETEDKKIHLSKPTFSRGLNELVKAKIIARAQRRGSYWINPNFIFNGDRIAFTSMFEREKQEEKKALND